MSRVFLSYSREDLEQASVVAEKLLERGYDLWWDAFIPPHKNFRDVIEENLHSASAIIVLWSPNSIRSQWVISEADYANSQGILIQMTLGDTTPPRPFEQKQFIGVSKWLAGDELEPSQLSLSLTQLAGEPGFPKASRAKRLKQSRNRRYIYRTIRIATLSTAAALLLGTTIIAAGNSSIQGLIEDYLNPLPKVDGKTAIAVEQDILGLVDRDDYDSLHKRFFSENYKKLYSADQARNITLDFKKSFKFGKIRKTTRIGVDRFTEAPGFPRGQYIQSIYHITTDTGIFTGRIILAWENNSWKLATYKLNPK